MSNSVSPIFNDDPPVRRTGAKNDPLNLFLQFFALLVCFGVPALVTALCPVAWVKFERQGERVSAKASVCLYFFIPFKTYTIDPVVSVGRDFKGGSTRVERRSGRNEKITSEDQGFLVIKGESQEAPVPVTPFNLDSVLEKSNTFLKDSQATELKMFVVANWKFSVFCGGLAMLLPLLLVGCIVYALGQKLFGAKKKA
ncbi:hypothetical protein DES53_106382 [Roseimicrobium gellanilyticum]|uniref:Uncharacterized protein n=1 Tax=Roseimicrobium gellanilyticum TaxID=748857 RepID=A0A366HLN8_9BACT|nr:hypothetical protein [Roseimicrobium gellanilyticum]RBP42673.1 hypothetical protein DES53_106382 [Roseimicrobium gellanilyticum]